MAAKKPPKQKEIKIEVPEFESYEPESIEDYSSTYKQKPLGVVDFSADTRGGAIEELKAQQSGYLDKKSKLLDDYYGDQGTNWGDIIAEALLTVGPIFAGYALDKKQGGIYGSQIGMQVGNNYRQTREQDKQLERYRIGQQLENVDAQISAADKLRQEYLEKEWGLEDQRALKADDREFEYTRDQRKREESFDDFLRRRNAVGGGGAQKQSAPFQPSDAYIEEVAQRNGKTPEQIREMLPETNADAYAQVAFGDFLGSRPKPVGQGAKDQIEAGIQSKYLLAEMRKDAALMAQDPGMINAIKGGKLIDAYKVPGSPAERFYRNALQLQKQIVRQNDGGRPTDKDFELMSPVVQGSPVLDSPESILARLQDLDAYTDFKLNSVVGLESATGRKTDKLQDMINGIGATPSDTSGNGWLDRVEQGQVPVSSNVPVKKAYTLDYLQQKGYSAAEIDVLRQQGRVR